MRIGVFSKFEMAGGSERRCVELANAITRHSRHDATLFSENGFPDRLREDVAPKVRFVERALVGRNECPGEFTDLDVLLVVNTDSKEFCRADYWQGRSQRHATAVDLHRVGQVVFLFNFIVSPARHLVELEGLTTRLKIITANHKFLDEIGEQERYRAVRHLPRTMLESPINPASVTETKTSDSRLRIGMHSTSNGDKWNQDWPRLIRVVNERCGAERILWRFMGMPCAMRARLAEFTNAIAYPEHAFSVNDFLQELDIFCFFTSWKREEAWSRSVAEALMSGCPVLATPRGGNRDQIVSGNNGLLCKDLSAFEAGIHELVDRPQLRLAMSDEARRRARGFRTEAVLKRFLEFLDL